MTIARSAQDARLTRLFSILTAAAVGMAALLALLPAAGHDQLWFLLMARRWLAGATLYGPQAFDSNPPAIIWLSAIAVRLGDLTHLPATLLGKLLVTLLETACALLSFRLLPCAWRKPRPWEAIALLFAAVVLFYVVPARDFGQRDHLVSFLLLPYILAAAIDPARCPLRPFRTIAGILAALAICLKPHHALVPLLIEAALLFFPRQLVPSLLSFRSAAEESASAPAQAVQDSGNPGSPHMPTASPSACGGSEPDRTSTRLRRLLRPEPVLIVLLGALYLALIRATSPLYFTEALPITRSVYWAIGHLTLPQLLWEAIELCLLAAITLWLFARSRYSPPAVRLLLLAGAASFAAYLLQGTGWYYQQLPAISFFGLALTLQLLDAAADRPLHIPTGLPRAATGLTILALALTTHFTGYPFTQDRAFSIDSPDPALFRSLPPGTPVAIFTTSVDEAMMPVERFHLTWAQRTNNLWLLPAILRFENSDSAANTPPAFSAQSAPKSAQSAFRLSPATLAALQHRWMVEDLTRWQPQLVLVERCQDPAVRCQVLEDLQDNLLAWFARDPVFATLWQQHYTFTRTDGRFDLYTRK